jgi:hypothetical protein
LLKSAWMLFVQHSTRLQTVRCVFDETITRYVPTETIWPPTKHHLGSWRSAPFSLPHPPGPFPIPPYIVTLGFRWRRAISSREEGCEGAGAELDGGARAHASGRRAHRRRAGRAVVRRTLRRGERNYRLFCEL